MRTGATSIRDAVCRQYIRSVPSRLSAYLPTYLQAACGQCPCLRPTMAHERPWRLGALPACLPAWRRGHAQALLVAGQPATHPMIHLCSLPGAALAACAALPCSALHAGNTVQAPWLCRRCPPPPWPGHTGALLGLHGWLAASCGGSAAASRGPSPSRSAGLSLAASRSRRWPPRPPATAAATWPFIIR